MGNEIIKRELRDLLGGLERERIFAEVKRRYQEIPLVSEGYRRFIGDELDHFAEMNRKTMTAIETFLIATAVIRPVITIAMLGGGPAMIEVMSHTTAHTATQVVGEVAISAACNVSGDVAVSHGTAVGIRALITRIFTGFYEERARVLATIINECMLGDRLKRIRRLAEVQGGQPLRPPGKLSNSCERLYRGKCQRIALPRNVAMAHQIEDHDSMSLDHDWNEDWEQAKLSAEFQRVLDLFVGWANDLPDWPAYQSAHKLIEVFVPRLREMQTNLSRILVVGVVGGTGVGKSTLINALLGARVCKTGDRRPTTCEPVILCHEDADPSFCHLDGEETELHKLDLPLLEEMVLVDCPDPDTQGADLPGNRNLEILRHVLPHCDVILYVGSAQKYKTHVVQQEVLRQCERTQRAVRADPCRPRPRYSRRLEGGVGGGRFPRAADILSRQRNCLSLPDGRQSRSRRIRAALAALAIRHCPSRSPPDQAGECPRASQPPRGPD